MGDWRRSQVGGTGGGVKSGVVGMLPFIMNVAPSALQRQFRGLEALMVLRAIDFLRACFHRPPQYRESIQILLAPF